MDEIADIISRYDEDYVSENLKTVEDIDKFALIFYKDVAEIYDCFTRIRNVERNPEGFSLDDAPILGLLVKVWKLLKEIVIFYEKDNAQMIGILDRPFLEAAITATFLLKNDNYIEDYRKCSYKDRLRILREFEEGLPFFDSKAGKRLLKSVREKMAIEGLSADDFGVQKKNRWRLGGMSFYDIFGRVDDEELYRYTYGIMSESIHGSWNESLDWDLFRNDDGTYSANPFYHPAAVRFVTPMLRFCYEPYKLWFERIEVDDEYLDEVFDWIERVNLRMFQLYDDKYDG